VLTILIFVALVAVIELVAVVAFPDNDPINVVAVIDAPDGFTVIPDVSKMG
jgi:hypothetical protein